MNEIEYVMLVLAIISIVALIQFVGRFYVEQPDKCPKCRKPLKVVGGKTMCSDNKCMWSLRGIR